LLASRGVKRNINQTSGLLDRMYNERVMSFSPLAPLEQKLFLRLISMWVDVISARILMFEK
jgi:vacuolar-type H+-ATPase subunit C/Vma6